MMVSLSLFLWILSVCSGSDPYLIAGTDYNGTLTFLTNENIPLSIIDINNDKIQNTDTSTGVNTK